MFDPQFMVPPEDDFQFEKILQIFVPKIELYLIVEQFLFFCFNFIKHGFKILQFSHYSVDLGGRML
jgi:hypothetical protein